MFRKNIILIAILLGLGMLTYVNSEALVDKGKDKGGPFQNLQSQIDALETRVSALEAASNITGNLSSTLIGTWVGTRIQTVPFPPPAPPWLLEELNGFTYTFNNDGTFTGIAGGGQYRIVGNNVFAGNDVLEDVRITGNTMTFMSNRQVGPSFGVTAYGDPSIYILTRQ